MSDEIKKLKQRIVDLEDALEGVIMVDKTQYDHHSPRPDGMKPRDGMGGGSCWLTPKELAAAALCGKSHSTRSDMYAALEASRDEFERLLSFLGDEDFTIVSARIGAIESVIKKARGER